MRPAGPRMAGCDATIPSGIEPCRLSVGWSLGLTPPVTAHQPVTDRGSAAPVSAAIKSEDRVEMDLNPALRQLADAYGIAVEFWDWQGRHVQVAGRNHRQAAGRAGGGRGHPGIGAGGPAAICRTHHGGGCCRRPW